MAHVAAALERDLTLALAARRLGAFERAFREVAGGQAARLGQDVGEHVRAVGGQALAGDRVLLERRREPLHRGVERLLVGVLLVAQPLVGDDDGLEALAAHDRAQATAAGEAVRVALHVGHGDTRGLQAGLAGGAVGDRGVPVVGGPHRLDGIGDCVVACALPLVDARQRSAAVRLDGEHVERVRVGRLAGDDQGGDAQAAKA